VAKALRLRFSVLVLGGNRSPQTQATRSQSRVLEEL